MKKLLAITLALALLLTAVAALAEEPIVITTGRSVSANQGYVGNDTIDDNLWYREYLNRYNIDLKNEWTVMESEYSTRLNLAIASGSIPDILYVENQTQLNTLVEAGMVADISSVYEQYASDMTKEFMNGDGGASLGMCTYNDKLYALPRMNATVYNVSLLWIRQSWLNNLGLEAPKTMQDVVEIARAFTFNDPDGNGQNDTYGLAISEGLLDGTASLVGFFNGYHAYPDHWLKQDDGTVVYGGVQTQVKDALTTLTQMYQDGLIDPDFAVKDTDKVIEEVQGRKFGMFFGQNWSGYSAGSKEDPWQEWLIMPAPSADEKEVEYSVYNPNVGFYVVSSECKHPEALVDMMNMYVDIVYCNNTADNAFITGYTEAGERVAQSTLAAVTTLTPDTATVSALKQLVSAVEARDPKLLEGSTTEVDKYEPSVKYLDDKDLTYFGQYGQYVAFKTIVEQIGQERLLENAFFGTTDTLEAKGSILDDYMKKMYTKIILGEEPVDAFDTFVAEWNRMGGEAITAEVNTIVNK